MVPLLELLLLLHHAVQVLLLHHTLQAEVLLALVLHHAVQALLVLLVVRAEVQVVTTTPPPFAHPVLGGWHVRSVMEQWELVMVALSEDVEVVAMVTVAVELVLVMLEVVV